MLLAFGVAIFAFKVQFVSRKFLFSYLAFCSLGLAFSKWMEFRTLHALRRLGFNTRSVLLVGEGAPLQEAYQVLASHEEWGYRVAGALGLGQRLPKGDDQPRPLGQLGDLEEVLRTRIVDEVVFAAAGKGREHMASVLETAGQAGVPVRVLLDPALKGLGAQVEPLGGLPSLVTSPDRRNPYLKLLKRLLDIVGAALALVLLLPLFALVALAILLTMGRPVLFRQKRAGTNGRVFFLYKFRTMVPDARKAQDKLSGDNEMDGPVFKVRHDPRITPLGRFLRKWTIDELPQFFNVLRGDMSLVGPRPLANYEARRVPHWARRRYSVAPGLTCYWQVMGRNALSFEEWMRLDLRYIDEWSLGLDLWLLLRTPWALLRARGAY
jgi:exopolysaccharide biosynthesis polyprenyl glycosylphosphotransferase